MCSVKTASSTGTRAYHDAASIEPRRINVVDKFLFIPGGSEATVSVDGSILIGPNQNTGTNQNAVTNMNLVSLCRGSGFIIVHPHYISW